PQNDVTLKMPAFEWVHVQLHQQKGMISLSPPTICNSAEKRIRKNSVWVIKRTGNHLKIRAPIEQIQFFNSPKPLFFNTINLIKI
ncbi:hypothetical protein Q4326_07685, partial [Acinetobacter baumannii]